jgi:hypothetical protein
MKEVIKNILKDLDGKKARVCSGGFYVEGSIEGDCLLKYDEHHGLIILTPARWNDTKVSELLRTTMVDLINSKSEDVSYNTLSTVMDAFKEKIETSYYRAGSIYPYRIVKIDVSGNSEGVLQSVKIHYADSIINLTIHQK